MADFFSYKLKTGGLFFNKDTKYQGNKQRDGCATLMPNHGGQPDGEGDREGDRNGGRGAGEATTDSLREKTRLFRCGSAEGI